MPMEKSAQGTADAARGRAERHGDQDGMAGEARNDCRHPQMAALGKHGRHRHGDGEMNRDEEEERHLAGLAERLEDQRDADEHRVRLASREARDHARQAPVMEEASGDPHGERPDHGDAAEIREPVAPGLFARNAGRGQGLEDQERDGDVVHEFRQAVAHSVRHIAREPRDITEEDDAENRQHHEKRVEHSKISAALRGSRLRA